MLGLAGAEPVKGNSRQCHNRHLVDNLHGAGDDDCGASKPCDTDGCYSHHAQDGLLPQLARQQKREHIQYVRMHEFWLVCNMMLPTDAAVTPHLQSLIPVQPTNFKLQPDAAGT
jgi:hypothetical protein